MPTDDRKHIEELSFRRIKAARDYSQQKKQLQNINVRKFMVPVISFEAKDYVDLIDGNKRLEGDVKERLRHLIQSICWKIIEKFKNGTLGTGSEILSSLMKIPCHTQATERIVKLLTDASEAV